MLEADQTFEDGGRTEADKIEAHEAAAHEKRQWIRLTSYCNNRCTFCLDSGAHNGTYVPKLMINTQIIEGRRKGATRLILSGGEPTIHPDYVKFIALGNRLGYRRIQTVTNGRLFAYPEFLSKCLDAGLGEITFSIHGHNAKVHDALVGVPGAFDEEVQGLKNALADGRVIVNVDVCLNKGNIRGLPELLDRFMEIGVREFDLLHIIPFGRAFEEGRESLFYDIDEAYDSIRYALKLSERPDLHIWFNRFPPPYLDGGYEHLIQDPYKLGDEVRGRFEEYERLLSSGTPLSCREPDRCHRCYLEHLCDTLDEKREAVAADAFEVYRVHLKGEGAPPKPRGTFAASWVCAKDAGTAAAAIPGLPGDEVILELDDYADIEAHLEGGRIAGRRLRAAYAARPEDLDRLLAIDEAFEVVAYLDRATTAHLLARYPEPPARLALSGRNYERLTEAAERDADLGAFFAKYDAAVPVEDVPACISGRPPRGRPALLDATMLREDGRLEIYGYAHRYVMDHYRTKSRKCRECVHFDDCAGAHINWVRAHGYATLEPVRDPARQAATG
jgi:MoaA/NifB/PqqE/SkfB family radical SAM enzyme